MKSGGWLNESQHISITIRVFCMGLYKGPGSGRVLFQAFLSGLFTKVELQGRSKTPEDGARCVIRTYSTTQ